MGLKLMRKFMMATLGEDGKLAKDQRPDVDDEPIEGSKNPVTSGGVFSAFQQKPNQNMIDNGYFVGGGSQQGGGQFPINQRGETEYKNLNTTYFIDRWFGGRVNVSLTSEGLSVQRNESSVAIGGYILQKISFSAIDQSEVVTVSAIVNGVLCCGTIKPPKSEGSYVDVDSGVGWYIKVSCTNNSLSFGIYVKTQEPVIIKAVKLELGPVQTLAHKEGDNWVLNEIPNYAEQYAICSQYSPITGEYIGIQHSNQNLIVNWYLIGGGSQQGGGQFPVNQRTAMEYTGAGYTADRWYNMGAFRVTLQDVGMKIECILPSNRNFWQPIENPSRLFNKQVTASILIAECYGTGHLALVQGSSQLKSVSFSSPGLYSFTYDVPPSLTHMEFKMGVETIGDYIVVKAVKLELGPVQTLAHKEGDNWVLNDPPPNYALELTKCQRYYVGLCGTTLFDLTVGPNKYFITNVRFPVEMRATPAVTIYSNANKDYGQAGKVGNYFAGGAFDDLTATAASVDKNGFCSVILTGTVPTSQRYGAIAYVADAEL